MSQSQPGPGFDFPSLDDRRADEFSAELRARAAAWIPGWHVEKGSGDFGGALLDILARFSSEVSETLDTAGDRMQRRLLDWLGVRGKSAHPARVPVVFQPADTATEAVNAVKPIQVEGAVGGSPVIFETEADVRVMPGKVQVVVAVDLSKDAYYLAPPGLISLAPLESTPTRWQIKNFTPAGALKLQLDPDLGIVPGMFIQAGGSQYTVVDSQNGLTTLDRPLESGLAGDAVVTAVTSFDPFGSVSHNAQQHAIYIGDPDLLNIEAPATIALIASNAAFPNLTWQYWGKVNPSDEAAWLSLDPQSVMSAAFGIVLSKPKASMELTEINGQKARWIRGMTTSATGPFQTEEIKLRINCTKDAALFTPPPAPPPAPPASAVEAMANTTPLVLSKPFYPLGREPRQFDAFYIGCEEALSKTDAQISVDLTMADASFATYAIRPSTAVPDTIAGIGKDAALYIFKLNAAGVLTKFHGPERPGGSQPVDLNVNCRPVIWNVGPDDFEIAVAAGRDIWIWHQNGLEPAKGSWAKHSSFPPLPNIHTQLQDILIDPSAPTRPGAALSDGLLWLFKGTKWSPGPIAPPYATVVPVSDPSNPTTFLMVAVSSDSSPNNRGKVYHLAADGTSSAAAPGIQFYAPSPNSNDPPCIRPAATRNGPTTTIVGVNNQRDKLIRIECTGTGAGTAWPNTPSRTASLPGANAIGAAVAVAQIDRKGQAILTPITEFSVGAQSNTDKTFLVASWAPDPNANPNTRIELLTSTVTGAGVAAGGTPVIVDKNVIFPGGQGNAFVAPFDPEKRLEIPLKDVGQALALPGPHPPFAKNDILSVLTAPPNSSRVGWLLQNDASVNASDAFYVVDPPATPVANDPQVIGYPASSVGQGTRSSSKTFTLAKDDPAVAAKVLLCVSQPGGMNPTFCAVKSVDHVNLKVTIDAQSPALPGSGTSPALEYRLPTPSTSRVSGAIHFLRQLDGDWDTSTFQGARVYVGDVASPKPQAPLALSMPPSNDTLIVLPGQIPASQVPIVFDNVISTWSQHLADTASNPALSWEYWNGNAWWSLPIQNDGTNQLANSGPVTFQVPADLSKTDWSGKSNFWIRARLIGGDYGQADVKVIDSPGPGAGQMQHTVERTTDNIRAPLAIKLAVHYEFCNEVYPALVEVEDSGGFRDLSDANKAPGAIVEAFVPISAMLDRLLTPVQAAAQLAQAKSPCECDCDGDGDPPAKPDAPSVPPDSLDDCGCIDRSGAAAPAAGPAAAQRAIFIGLTAPPSEAPVNLLFLVDDNDMSNFAPMTVDALTAGMLQRLVVDDATRVLGEDGLLGMTFAKPPTPTELFGQTQKPLSWLLLRPKPAQSDQWRPKLRGVYLNAMWAASTETLTRELLGSSSGAPEITVQLARPPVLDGTLELRVREPLGVEERDALLAQDANSVKSAEDGMPGDWVLWRPVVEPLDEPPDARVYALDEQTGRIRFGDGLHGMIPPTGRDCIVAFRYQRFEPAPAGTQTLPANTITARTALSLVSPVEGVSAVIAADDSAGGAPPEPDARVLRFGSARLRHRDRAITLSDLEQIALENSPDIAQARAFPKGGFVRLVLVMRGLDPQPTAAQRREFTRELLDALPPSFAESNTLRIAGPKVRQLRIELPLHIATLEHAASVSAEVKQRLKDLFDTAAGGVDQDGWALGVNPTADDVAFALIDTPNLVCIGTPTLLEVGEDESEQPWPITLGQAELAMLVQDPLRFEFEIVEVIPSPH